MLLPLVMRLRTSCALNTRGVVVQCSALREMYAFLGFGLVTSPDRRLELSPLVPHRICLKDDENSMQKSETSVRRAQFEAIPVRRSGVLCAGQLSMIRSPTSVFPCIL